MTFLNAFIGIMILWSVQSFALESQRTLAQLRQQVTSGHYMSRKEWAERIGLALTQIRKNNSLENIEIVAELLGLEAETLMWTESTLDPAFKDIDKFNLHIQHTPLTTIKELYRYLSAANEKYLLTRANPRLKEVYGVVSSKISRFTEVTDIRESIFTGIASALKNQGLLDQATKFAKDWASSMKFNNKDQISSTYWIAELAVGRYNSEDLKDALETLKFFDQETNIHYIWLQANLDYLLGNYSKCEADLAEVKRSPDVSELSQLIAKHELVGCMVGAGKFSDADVMIRTMNTKPNILATAAQFKFFLAQKNKSEAYALCPTLAAQINKDSYFTILQAYAICLSVKGNETKPTGFEAAWTSLRPQLDDLSKKSNWVRLPLELIQALESKDKAKIEVKKAEIEKLFGKKSMLGQGMSFL